MSKFKIVILIFSVFMLSFSEASLAKKKNGNKAGIVILEWLKREKVEVSTLALNCSGMMEKNDIYAFNFAQKHTSGYVKISETSHCVPVGIDEVKRRHSCLVPELEWAEREANYMLSKLKHQPRLRVLVRIQSLTNQTHFDETWAESVVAWITPSMSAYAADTDECDLRVNLQLVESETP